MSSARPIPPARRRRRRSKAKTIADSRPIGPETARPKRQRSGRRVTTGELLQKIALGRFELAGIALVRDALVFAQRRRHMEGPLDLAADIRHPGGHAAPIVDDEDDVATAFGNVDVDRMD